MENLDLAAEEPKKKQSEKVITQTDLMGLLNDALVGESDESDEEDFQPYSAKTGGNQQIQWENGFSC